MRAGESQFSQTRIPGYGLGDLARRIFTRYVWEDFDEQGAYELVRTAAENAHKFNEYFAAGKAAGVGTFVSNIGAKSAPAPAPSSYGAFGPHTPV